MSGDSILKSGQNCWVRAHASRTAFLIDGNHYYPTLHSALQRAEHSIYILGWDIDGRIRLLRDHESSDYPRQLGALLNALSTAKKDLQIYILNWDWAMLYSLEREWLPMYKHDWVGKKNLHFELDDTCPPGASHHQKVVVIDDQLAFCGGFDLGKHRWDSSAHAADDPRRIDPDDNPYPPFHDVQIMVEGEAAAKLGELARARWLRATGNALPPPERKAGQSAWPEHVQPDIQDCRIAIARTLSAFCEFPETREVERLYLDAIAAAEQFIYIENQYFTSDVVTKALVETLKAENGPEVVLVLPFKTGGWLEQNTMDILRCNALDTLKQADRYDRLRVYYPHRDELGDNTISVHSKMLIIDDRLMRVGSSNLSNRSMGLDSECDLAIEAENAAQSAAIRHFRNRLLAEHLDASESEVEANCREHGSLIQTIAALNTQKRYLKPLETVASEVIKEALPQEKLIDPERPISSRELAELMLPIEEEKTESQRLRLLIGFMTGLLLLGIAWRWTPMKELLDLDTLESTANWVKNSAFSPVIVVLLFVAGGLIAIPVNLMILATILAFGPILGGAYAYFGAVCAALGGYAVGKKLGRRVITRWTGSHISRLSRRLGKHGLVTVITVRIIPLAPFTITNLVAGASHINLRNFTWGTLIGLIPGVTFLAIFTDTLVKTIQEPDGPGLFTLALVMLILFVLGWLTKYWIRQLAANSA